MSSYLDIPKNERLSLPLRQWPESDQVYWLRALTIESSITRRIQPAMWRPRYRADCERSYGVYLRWLRDQALVRLDAPLATRTARDNVVRFIRWHRAHDYAPATIATRVERLHMVVQVIEPDTDWLWFYDLRKALNHAVMESVRFQENLPEVSALWQLGWTLMRGAKEIEVRYEERRATRFRAGLMIAMLAACPCRTGNLVAMSVDRNLTRRGRQYVVSFRRDQMKSRRSFESPLPAELTEPIDEYLTVYRPLLVQRSDGDKQVESDALWVSIRHGRLSAQAFRGHLRLLSEEHLKFRMSPHRFRHAAATSIARNDPMNAHIMRRVLGHTSAETGRRSYDFAGSIAASRAHAKLIAAMRKAFRPKGTAGN